MPATPLEPEIGADGLDLTFRVPQLAAGAERHAALRRRRRERRRGRSTLVNRATAHADNGSRVEHRERDGAVARRAVPDLGLLLGRVIAGTCDTTVDAGEGIAGVRVYLEDGRYAVTDDEGKYHFEGLTPGSHVVQLDTITLPAELEPLRCDTRVRSAGSAHRRSSSTCAAARSARPISCVAQRAAPDGRRAPLAVDDADRPTASSTWPRSRRTACRCREAELLVLLPDVLEYVPGSAARDGAAVRRPRRAERLAALRARRRRRRQRAAA